MTGFLDLPFEVRKIVYDDVLANIVEGHKRVFWVPDVLEKDIDHQTLAITYSRGSNFRRQENGPFGAFGSECPAIHHRDIPFLVPLAQTCKALHKEVCKLVWGAADLKVQGSLDMICGLLSSRLTHDMSLNAKDAIVSMQLIVSRPWKENSLQAMKEIVEIINTHLPALKVLNLSLQSPVFKVLNPSFSHVTLHAPMSVVLPKPCSPAKALLSQLLFLRPELPIAFQAYYQTRLGHNHYHSSFNAGYLLRGEVIELLRNFHAINRGKAIDRQRKKVESARLDADYYIHMTLGLRSSTHYEEVACCFDHKVQNHLRKIRLPGLKITSRCASPESDDLGSLLPKEWEQKTED